MKTREIRVSLDSEPYKELYSAMMEHREYDDGYVIQYSECQEQEGMVAVFLMRESLTQESDKSTDTTRQPGDTVTEPISIELYCPRAGSQQR